jgi:predicted nucleic-acid-binding protein
LETEWVLRAVYGLEPAAILHGLMQVLGLPNTVAEHATEVAFALDCYRQGMDLADALYVASSADAERFYTFDRNFVKAGKQAGVPVVRLE